jgi:hypothetical protein
MIQLWNVRCINTDTKGLSMSKFKFATFSVTLALFIFANSASVLGKPSPPPWSAKPVKAKQVPEVYYSQWYRADNQKDCGLLVLTAPNKGPMPKIRKASFSGGWAVAYDLPNERSSYGIAGTGVLALDNNDAKAFPNLIRWSDGSYASYGLEGNTGPGYLAYVTVAGQGCLYNVWSKRGKKHLEELLYSMRFAEKAGK